MTTRTQAYLSLYRRLLGPAFDLLPARLRELHDVTETAVWVGRADVERGRTWFARTVATLLSLPPDGKDHPLCVSFEPGAGREVWTRAFGAHQFRSVQFLSDGLLGERVGAVSLVSALVASAEGLTLQLRKVLVLGMALPRGLHPGMRTFESQRGGRYRFEVEVHLPLGGLLVRYAGWLERAGSPSA